MTELLTEVLEAVHRNHRANWQWNHCDGGRCAWTSERNLPPLPDHEAHVAAHLADAVRAWLLGQEGALVRLFGSYTDADLAGMTDSDVAQATLAVLTGSARERCRVPEQDDHGGGMSAEVVLTDDERAALSAFVPARLAKHPYDSSICIGVEDSETVDRLCAIVARIVADRSEASGREGRDGD